MGRFVFFFFFQAEDGIRDFHVTGVQTCALPISSIRAVAVAQEGNVKPGGGGSHSSRRRVRIRCRARAYAGLAARLRSSNGSRARSYSSSSQVGGSPWYRYSV